MKCCTMDVGLLTIKFKKKMDELELNKSTTTLKYLDDIIEKTKSKSLKIKCKNNNNRSKEKEKNTKISISKKDIKLESEKLIKQFRDILDSESNKAHDKRNDTELMKLSTWLALSHVRLILNIKDLKRNFYILVKKDLESRI